jgi:hypothetical protein
LVCILIDYDRAAVVKELIANAELKAVKARYVVQATVAVLG